jgi:sugar lactone lactonase YvrE
MPSEPPANDSLPADDGPTPLLPPDPYATRYSTTDPTPDQPAPTPAAPSDPYQTRATPDTELADPSSRPLLPRRYDVKKLLGQGGMGDVWLGRDRRLRRPVAVKVVQERWREHPHVVRRFEEEAQLTSQLQHPAIPPVYDMGQLADGRPYFCMKVVRGRTLGSLLEKRSGPGDDLPRFLAIFEQVCQAVAYAHSKGVIHRDLKPHNVMVGAFGEVQVMDWGLAKVLASRGRQRPEEEPAAASAVETDRSQQADNLTQAGSVLGTFAYMPPEQARGEVAHLDKRCDVFGLGAMLCEVLTGRPPYEGRREEVRRHAQMGLTQGALERLAACPADASLTALVRSCLSVRAADRPADAKFVAAEVAAYLAAVQEHLRRAEVERAAAAAREEEAKATAAAQAREEKAKATAAAERTARRLSVALAVVLLLGIGAALAFGVEAVRRAADARAAQANAEEEKGKAEAASRLAETQKKSAEEAQHAERWQRELAEQLKTEAEQAKEREKREHDRAERLLYAKELELAQREWEANHAAAAWQHLEATRRDLRGWEYHHLATFFNRGQITVREHTGPVTCVAFSPQGKFAASASADRTVKLWRVDNGHEEMTFKGHGRTVTCVAFSSDGQRLVSGGEDESVRLWNVERGWEVRTLGGRRGSVRGVAFSPDGRRIASAGSDRTVTLWDADGGREIRTLKGHDALVTGVAFSPDGKDLATASEDQTVRLWDVGTGQEICTLRGHTGSVTGVAFSPDGLLLATASEDGSVKLWNAERGWELGSLKGHKGAVNGVAFSPDGKRLASAGADGTVKVWDSELGLEVLTLKGHAERVTGVAFSPDNSYLASASNDETVKVWEVEMGLHKPGG